MNRYKKSSLLLIMIFLVSMFLVGCGASKKEPLTSDRFKEIMELNGYNVFESTERYEGEEQVVQAMIALHESDTYQIDWCKTNNTGTAISYYNAYKNEFEYSASIIEAKTSLSGENFDRFMLVTGTEYKFISRIADTLVIIETDISNKGDIENILEQLGY